MKIFFGTRKFLSGGVLIFNRRVENISKKGDLTRNGWRKNRIEGVVTLKETMVIT